MRASPDNSASIALMVEVMSWSCLTAIARCCCRMVKWAKFSGVFLKDENLLSMGLMWIKFGVTLVTRPILSLLGADKDITLSLTVYVGGSNDDSASILLMVRVISSSCLNVAVRCCCKVIL